MRQLKSYVLKYLMDKVIKLKKGLNLSLAGQVTGFVKDKGPSSTFAIKPTDFLNVVPKLEVKVGDEVKAGQPLFHNKKNDSIKFTAPVSGEIVAINRGAKRLIEEIVILADKQIKHQTFDAQSAIESGSDAVKEQLLLSGAWVHLKQRPFNIVADPNSSPKAIFISGFDSAPLSADVNVLLEGEQSNFQKGIDALNTLTDGKVHLGLPSEGNVSPVLSNAKDVNKHYFNGPHPAGNVGVQIHFINPINKGDVVYTVTPQDVVIIGRLFNEGVYNTSKIIALSGSQFLSNHYIKTYVGAQISHLIQHNIKTDDTRIISGNILCGEKIAEESYLGFYDNSVTAIPEGADPEFLGWLLPTYERPTASRAFVWLKRVFTPGVAKGFTVNANMHGEERAFVVTGEYDKVVPMDILPNQLIKSVLANDIDKMEQLGIYEVVEEDLALCEFVCTSKLPVQQILRDGLNFVQQEA